LQKRKRETMSVFLSSICFQKKKCVCVTDQTVRIFGLVYIQ
jgi:hypothetical protein